MKRSVLSFAIAASLAMALFVARAYAVVFQTGTTNTTEQINMSGIAGVVGVLSQPTTPTLTGDTIMTEQQFGFWCGGETCEGADTHDVDNRLILVVTWEAGDQTDMLASATVQNWDKNVAQSSSDIHCAPQYGPPAFEATGKITVSKPAVEVGETPVTGGGTTTTFEYTFAHTTNPTNVLLDHTNGGPNFQTEVWGTDAGDGPGAINWDVVPGDPDTHKITAAVDVKTEFTGSADEIKASAHQKLKVQLMILITVL